VPGPINYWVVDKDTPVKVPSTPMLSVSSPIDTTNSTNQYDIASQWLPSADVLTSMDPNEPEPFMKLPISIEYDSLRYDTSVLIDSAATLNFVSQELFIRNGLVGKCVRGPKIAVRIANERRISTNKSFPPTSLFIHQIKFTSLTFVVLPHLKCVDFVVDLPALKDLQMSIQPSNNLVMINDRSFPCESQPRRVSRLLVDSSKMQKILTKAVRNKHNDCELFLVSLHFDEELQTIKTDFGSELDAKLKELITEFVDVTQEPQGLSHIEVSSIIRSVLLHIQNVNVVIACPSLNLKNLSDSALTFSNKG